eukprot:s7622_g1.t1
MAALCEMKLDLQLAKRDGMWLPDSPYAEIPLAYEEDLASDEDGEEILRLLGRRWTRPQTCPRRLEATEADLQRPERRQGLDRPQAADSEEAARTALAARRSAPPIIGRPSEVEPLLERAGQRAAEVERAAARDEQFASQQLAEAEAAGAGRRLQQQRRRVSNPCRTSYNVTVARAFTKLLGAFVTFPDTDEQICSASAPILSIPAMAASSRRLESQMQLGALQYPRYPVASDAEHFHFLEIL